MRSVTVRQRARVIVDPNSVSSRAPGLTVASFADADRIPAIGETVTASQPDEDGSDFAGIAIVTDVNHEHELIYLNVQWDTFHDVASAPAYRIHDPINYSPGTHLRVSELRTTRRLRPDERNGALLGVGAAPCE